MKRRSYLITSASAALFTLAPAVLSTLAPAVLCTLMATALFSVSALAQPSSLAKDIIGAWGNSDDNGLTYWGQDEYREDGTVIASGTYPGALAAFRTIGTYEIKGQTICIRVKEASEESKVSVGEARCVQILEINGQFKRFKFIDGDEEFKQFRVNKRT
jgi:hypothetical protein